jgi:hypothetical protein
VSRLWSRSGLRVLSILVLLLGLLGGVFLHNNQPTRSVSSADRLPSDDRPVLVPDVTPVDSSAATGSMFDAAQAAAQHAAAVAAASASAAAQKAQQAARRSRAAAAASRSESRTKPAPKPSVGPIPKSCSAYSGNRAIGCSLLLKAGFGLDQMPCLDKMWTRESNWRTEARNPSSGAGGIPQALPMSKMAAFGSDYRTNPATQIKWGLDYIEKRYSTPCGAWAFWQSHNWY